eukprot:GEMP01027816.1.p1 GENE.GEMP01027816.1~~GEMP01027816.1.p1  ORF type:complete len:515 (-),score=91.54 GEMP01027816.1:771-2291(-)
MKRAAEDGHWTAKKPTKRVRSDISLQQNGSNFKPSVADVQNLILRCLTEDQGENPKWAFVKNMRNVKHATVLLVPNLDILQLKNKEHLMPTLWSLYGQKGLVMRPMFLQRKTSLLRELLASKAASRIPYGYSHPAAAYLVPPEELQRNDFPPACYGGRMEEGWVRSSPSNAVPDMNHLLAIDCEMVETDQGSGQLARVSVLDQNGSVLMDRLCRPPGRVTNYLTQFSGITEEMLKTTSLVLKDLQEELLTVIRPNSVLVGHGLENDLWAMKLVHPHIIDTALLFPHPQGWPKKQSLQVLGFSLLKKKLDRTNGHNSIEDARMTMLLVMTKIQKGPSFGSRGADEIAPLGALMSTHIFEEKMETLPEKWLTDKSAQFDLNDEPVSEWPNKMRKHKGQVNIITLRAFQTSGGSDDGARNLDRHVKSIVDVLEDNELLVVLTCGDLEDYWRLVDDQRQARHPNPNDDPAVVKAREELLQRRILHSRGRLDSPLGIFTIIHREDSRVSCA